MQKDGKSHSLSVIKQFPPPSSVSPGRCFKNQEKRLQAVLIIRLRNFDPICLIDTAV